MDWRAVVTTFGLVFLAEIGDKTQLSVMLMAAHQRSPFSVWVGAVLALALASLVAVVIGGAITKLASPRVINMVAGAVFLLFGVLLLTGRF